MSEDLKNEFWTLMDQLYDFSKKDSNYYHSVTSKGEELLLFFQKATKHLEQERQVLMNSIRSKDDYISELKENEHFMQNTIKTLENDKKKLEKRSNLDEIKNIVFS